MLTKEKIIWKKGKSINGTKFDDLIEGTNYTPDKKNKGLTIKAGLGNDTITGSSGNDIITGGLGTNIYNYSLNNGEDTIVLTKGENFTLDLKDLTENDLNFDIVKGNLEITFDKLNANNKGKVILKTFASKDVINNANIRKGITDTSSVKITFDGTNAIDLRDYLYTVNTNKNYKGSRLDEEIHANINSPVNAKKNTGLTLDGGLGNDILYGSKYKDTLIGGKGEDKFVFDGNFSEDTIKDGSNEDTIECSDLKLSQLKFFKNGNNLEIRNTEDANNKVIVLNYFKTKQEKRIEKLTVLKEDGSATEDKLLSNQTITITGKGSINGSNNADDILGSDFNDNIKGNDGNDTINAGKGNDNIYGGKGNDVFVFTVSDGVDTIKDGDSSDTIKFTDLKLENLSFIRNGNNLEIYNDKDKKDKITVTNYFKTKANERIDKLVDSTETEYSIKNQTIYITGKGKINGFADNDNILGSDTSDTIKANAGDDVIASGAGNDNIYGGKGNDTINAGAGNNQLYFNTGDGTDTIQNGSGNDTLVFLNEKNINNIELSYSNSDLVVKYGKNDSVIIEDYSENHSVQSIKIGKSVHSIKDLLEINEIPIPEPEPEPEPQPEPQPQPQPQPENIIGTDGDDTINNTTTENHIVNAKKGNDSISVANGNNKYIFNTGDGNDTIISGTGTDIISFSTAQTLTYSHDCANNDLIVSYGDNDNITLKDYFVNNSHSVATIINGNDTLSIANEIEKGITIINTNKNITTLGTNGSDIIHSAAKGTTYGQAGNDVIYGGSDGWDNIYLYGDDGNDTIYACKFQDLDKLNYYNYVLKNVEIHGGNGNDLIMSASNPNILVYGDNGDDIINAYQGTIYGGKGDDTINILQSKVWQYSDDIGVYYTYPYCDASIYGDDGNDIITSGGKSTIYGGNGDDIISTNSGIVYGGDGNDEITIRYSEIVDGGNGNDTIHVTYPDEFNRILGRYTDSGTEEDFDVLILDNISHSDLKLYFNVDRNGNVVGGSKKSTSYDYSDCMLSFTRNYSYDSKVWTGSGFNEMALFLHNGVYNNLVIKNSYDCFEKIVDCDGYYITKTQIDSVAAELANWLNNERPYNGDYSESTLFDYNTSTMLTGRSAINNIYESIEWQAPAV